MRKHLPWLAAVAVAFIIGGALVALASRQRVNSPMQIHVVEHAVHEAVGNVGKKGDSHGDQFTFSNPVYDATDSKKVGKDLGDCIRIRPSAGQWYCIWTTWIKGKGSIAIAGPFYDDRSSTMAITGGSGMFANARGTMTLSVHPGGKYNFVFHILP
jgi:hypothetical protein